MNDYKQGQIFTHEYAADAAAWCVENGCRIVEIEASADGLRQFEICPDTAPDVAVLDDLKQQLSATDYKIIKAYEYALADEPLPYDIKTLHAQRQELREKINLLENKSKNGPNHRK